MRVIAGRSYGEPMTYWAVFPDIRAAEQRYVPDRAQSILGNLPIGYHAGLRFRHSSRRVPGADRARCSLPEIFARNDLSDGNARVKVELDSADAGAAEMQVELLAGELRRPIVSRRRSHCELPAGPSVQSLEIPMPEAQASGRRKRPTSIAAG